MNKLKDNVSYIIGFLLLIIAVIDLVKMIMNIDGGGIIRYLYDILFIIGAIVFILSNILGIMPVSSSKKALFDEILGYLSAHAPRSGEMYKVPPELYDRLENNKRDEEVLSLLAKDICAFCDIDSTDLSIHVRDDLAEAAGTFNAYYSEIHISLINTRTAGEVLAVLIHECMHYILREKKLWLESREKNEYLTDIACLYFGFGNYINRGYILIGYLKRNEIRYLMRLI